MNEDSLTSYLEGLLSEPARTAAEEHLVGCDQCRSQLVYYMRILDDDVREDEESVLRAVMATMEDSKIDEIRGGSPPVPAAPARRLSEARWLALAASLLVAVSVGWFATSPDEPTPGEIVDALLSDSRPFEPRLSEQPYRRLFETRGPSQPSATPALEEEMRRQAATDYLMGTFYLVNKEFDRAISFLGQAAAALERDASDAGASSPEDARVHNNLGVAYLERNHPDADRQILDMDRARDHFERAVGLDPKFAPAVYNLALLFNRLDLPAEVRIQARRYLELDPESPWASEVRQLVSMD